MSFPLVDKIISPDLVDWLNTIIIERPYIFLNYWSILHFLAGIIFYKYISKDFKLWIKINIIFEIVEFMLGISRHPLFYEEMADIAWDVILSLGGFKLAERYKL